MAAPAVSKASSSTGTDDSLDQVECDITERNEASADPPIKKRLFDDEESSSSDEDSEEGGAQLGSSPAAAFKVNEEYARRFEHNKKREERQKLEEKYGPGTSNGNDEDSEDESDSSSDVTEDEAGFLATEDLDAEISATLQALKNKDPRIYDANATFYRPFNEASAAAASKKGKEKEKPVYLQDYHRERYMKGDVGADFDDEDANGAPPLQTYAQEQASIKKSIVDEINTLVDDGPRSDDSESDGDEFIRRKPGQEAPAATADGVHPSRARRVQLTELDVANADKDPELFLSNFMASRAWAPSGDGRHQWEAFESDDDDGDGLNIAEEFENAYNMRFEDPEKSNEFLKTYSRTVVSERTVRREEKKGRKKARELEKEMKEAEKLQRKEERARLRRLKVEETEEKLKKIKHAAGLSGKTLKDEEWTKLLEGAWENDTWEEEMLKQFGDQYYAEVEGDVESSDEEGEGASSSKKRKKPKKPKWDDDIDIKDIIPDFDDSLPQDLLSDDEGGDQDDADAAGPSDDDGGEEQQQNPTKKRKTSRDHKKDRQEARRTARQERLKIEALVDRQMELDDPAALASAAAASSSKQGGGGGGGRSAPAFRYRETSPNAFGLTARDILLAPSDAALNEFAGLKKLASFRDAEKKRKDKKRLGKKARLRQWRRDNFGREFEQTGPTYGFERVGEEEDEAAAADDGGGWRKKKMEKKLAKAAAAAAGGAAVSEEKKQEDEEQQRSSRKRKRSRGKKAAAAA